MNEVSKTIEIEVNTGSFKKSSVPISLTKDITLFWGYNGSGKTSIARAIRKKGETKDVKALVYDTDFVRENFLEEELKGIYLGASDIKTHKLKKEKVRLYEEHKKAKAALEAQEEGFQEKVWDEREKIVGARKHIVKGERKGNLAGEVKKYIPESRGGSQAARRKEELEVRIKGLYPAEKELKKREGINLEWFTRIKQIANNSLLQETIMGSKDVNLSKLIEAWGNSDWVRRGKEEYMDRTSGKCPFCQEKLPDGFVEKINNYFDKAYENKIQELKSIKKEYENEKYQIINKLKEIVKGNKDDKDLYSKFRQVIHDTKSTLEGNVRYIDKKIENPSNKITLLSIDYIKINPINEDVRKNNENFNKLDNNRKKLKEDCLMYLAHKTHGAYQEIKTKEEEKNKKCNELKSVSKHLSEIREQNDRVKRSAEYINDLLVRNGFTDFRLEPEGDKYKIVRENGEDTDVYRTLSEGEKQLITFFYFITLCDGSLEEHGTEQKYDIIAIDDPVSSLSFTFVYEIAHLIQDKFFKKQNDTSTHTHFVLLTHNIYFLQRLKRYLPRKLDEYKCRAEMKRVKKGEDNKSKVVSMEPNEIQNEYEMLWEIVKEAKGNDNAYSHPTLANAMRQILECFFGFIKKEDHLESVKDTAFKNEIQAGVHRGRIENCIDIGKTDIQKSIECFKSIFRDEGFPEHYNVMMGELNEK